DSMLYLELLKFASPEAIVVLTALVVLTIGLATGRRTVAATVSASQTDAFPGDSAAKTQETAGDAPVATTSGLCSFVAALGLVLSASALFMLPRETALFHGMLVITPL